MLDQTLNQTQNFIKTFTFHQSITASNIESNFCKKKFLSVSKLISHGKHNLHIDRLYEFQTKLGAFV